MPADSTNSLKRTEVHLPAEPANQRHEACLKSHVLPRLKEPNLVGGRRSLLFSFSLIDQSNLQGILIITLTQAHWVGHK